MPVRDTEPLGPTSELVFDAGNGAVREDPLMVGLTPGLISLPVGVVEPVGEVGPTPDVVLETGKGGVPDGAREVWLNPVIVSLPVPVVRTVYELGSPVDPVRVLTLDTGNGGRLCERVEVPTTAELCEKIDPVASCVVWIAEVGCEPVGPTLDVVFDTGNGGEVCDIMELGRDVSLFTVVLVRDNVSLPMGEVVRPLGPLDTPVGPTPVVEFVIGNGGRVSEGAPGDEMLPLTVVNEPGYCDVPLPVGIGKVPGTPEVGDVGFGKTVEFDRGKGCVID